MTDTATSTERPRLRVKYDTEVRDALKEQLGLANIMQVPRLEKIVINMGVGKATQQPSLLEGAVRDLQQITGQKPLVTKARKSIASFKLREGNAIGAKVTLRGDRMWEFLDRLVSIALPRIRDFRGLSPDSFDGRGNYSRCNRCGRPRAVFRKFGLCRICLREAAHNGYVPGMTKSSW